MKVKDHLKIAEYVGSDFSHPVAGHYYSHTNDPVSHGNHVHVAFLPWGEPDEHGAKPKDQSRTTAAADAYRAAFEARFGTKYRWGGTYVYKHRNSDDGQPFSQHAFGNAVDYMADGKDQDPIIDWLESEWEDPMLDPDKDKATFQKMLAEQLGTGEGRLPQFQYAVGMYRRHTNAGRPGDGEPEQQAGYDDLDALLKGGGGGGTLTDHKHTPGGVQA